MQVVAFSTPAHPEWRWRLVNFAGDIVEESHHAFASIAAAITDGTRRMDEVSAEDLSSHSRTFVRNHYRSR
jgi:hypothetical protein